uniref:CCHC-type domain-containing protein n=1 Tax=Anolis carolinensis TaxID=28377 RepID=A0A803SNE1_ANOCA
MVQARLVQLSKRKWPLVALEGGVAWPPHGSEDESLILKLQSHCHGEGKWTQLAYAAMFMALSQRESGRGEGVQVFPCRDVGSKPTLLKSSSLDLLPLPPPPEEELLETFACPPPYHPRPSSLAPPPPSLYPPVLSPVPTQNPQSDPSREPLLPGIPTLPDSLSQPPAISPRPPSVSQPPISPQPPQSSLLSPPPNPPILQSSSPSPSQFPFPFFNGYLPYTFPRGSPFPVPDPLASQTFHPLLLPSAPPAGTPPVSSAPPASQTTPPVPLAPKGPSPNCPPSTPSSETSSLPPRRVSQASEDPFEPLITKNSLRTRPATVMAPLREVVGARGDPVLIHVPFSTTDLITWKKTTAPLSQDPSEMTELFRTIFLTHRPSWADVMTLLGSLLTQEEKRRLLAAAQAEIMKADVDDGRDSEIIFPTKEDPGWDYNTNAGMMSLKAFHRAILAGLPLVYPRPINLSKYYDIKQTPEESPSDFYDRLCRTAKQWTHIDPSDPRNASSLNSLFIGRSCRDIRLKLQKLEGGAGMPISQLINIAFKVFHNREDAAAQKEEDDRQAQAQVQAASMVAALAERDRGRGVGENRERPVWRDRGQGRESPRELRCYYCQQRGHYRRECPDLKDKGAEGRVM